MLRLFRRVNQETAVPDHAFRNCRLSKKGISEIQPLGEYSQKPTRDVIALQPFPRLLGVCGQGTITSHHKSLGSVLAAYGPITFVRPWCHSIVSSSAMHHDVSVLKVGLRSPVV